MQVYKTPKRITRISRAIAAILELEKCTYQEAVAALTLLIRFYSIKEPQPKLAEHTKPFEKRDEITEKKASKAEGRIPIEGSGTSECIDHAAALMLHLGNLLLPSDKKIRVIIERDPGAGRFTVKRETLP